MKHFVLLITIVCFGLSTLSGQSSEYHLDEKYPIDPNGSLELRSNDAEVSIKGSDRTDIRLVVHREIVEKAWPKKKYEENFFIEVELDQDEAIIREVIRDKLEVNVGFHYVNEKRYTIDIEVPKGLDLKLYGDDDDYLVVGMEGTVLLDAEDGDAEFRNCTGNDFEIRLDDGDLYLSNGNGKLDIRGEDGDFTIVDGNFEQVRAQIDDGSMILSTHLYDEGRYDLRSEDGDIDLEILGGGGQIDVYHSDGHVRFGKEFEVRRESEHRTQLNYPNGSATVDIEMDDGRVRIKTLKVE